jgi:hypothetical protein
MKGKSLILLLILTLPALSMTVLSQTSEYSFRSSVNLEMKITRRLKVELAPEFRYNTGSGNNLVLVQTGLNYRVASWLSIGGFYRLNGSILQESESADGKLLDFSNRFAFDANVKTNLGRFTPKFRVRFCNFPDFDSRTDDKADYLRYRLGLDYLIKGIKLTPFFAVEFYEKLSSGLFCKSRYTVGGEYEFNKMNALSLGYSFDDKFKTTTKYHIFELTCKFRF